jgi:hypothetical protein
MTRFARPLAAALALSACFEISPPAPCTRHVECGEGAFCSDAGACVPGPTPGPGAPDGGGGETASDGAPPRPDAVTSTPPPDTGPPRDGSTGGSPGPDAAAGGSPGPDAGSGGSPGPDAGAGGTPGPDAAAGGSPGPDAAAGGSPGPDAGAGGSPGPDAFIDPDAPLRNLQVEDAPWLRLGHPVLASVDVSAAVDSSEVEWTATVEGRDAAEIDPQGAASVTLTPQVEGEMTITAALVGNAAPPVSTRVTVYDCVDVDGDGAPALTGVAPEVLSAVEAARLCGVPALDCDDAEFFATPGRAEVCDGLDNDCDDQVDTGAQLDTVDHCGTCDTSCLRANVDVECRAGLCEFVACVSGFLDSDDNLENGCDIVDPDACEPIGEERVCDGVDDDCDGVIDDVPGGCTAWVSGFCAARRARGLRDAVCEDFDAPLRAPWRNAYPDSPQSASFTVSEGRLIGSNTAVEGTSRSIPLTHGAFSVRFRAAVSGETSLGVFLTVDDQLDNAGRPVGYTLRLEPGERVSLLTNAGVMGEFVHAVWSVPGANDGEPRVFEWSRDAASGRHGLTVDGRFVPSEPPNAVGAVLAGLSRLAVGFDAPGPFGANDGVDDLVFSADADLDEVLTPADNCPELTSADTLDADGDGRGRPCEDLDLDGFEDGFDRCRAIHGQDCPAGPGHLLVGLTAGGSWRPWSVEPTQGTRTWLAPESPEAPWSAADGRPTGETVVVALNDEFGTLLRGIDATSGATTWLYRVPVVVGDLAQVSIPGNAVYFTNETHQALWRLDPSTGETRQWGDVIPGEHVRIAASPEGFRVWVARFSPGIATLVELDANFTARSGPIVVSGEGVEPESALALSPAGDRLLFAGPAGIAIYHMAAQVLEPLTFEPARRAVFTGAGTHVAALVGDPLALVLYDAAGGPSVALIPPHAGLSDAILSHVPGGVLPDADHDGLADAQDACPGVPPYSPRTGIDIGGVISDFVQVLVAGNETVVARIVAGSVSARRLTPDLRPLGREVSAPLDTDVAPAIAWDGTGFALASLARDLADSPLQLLELGLDLGRLTIAQHIQGVPEDRALAGPGRTVALAPDPEQGWVFAYGNEVSLFWPGLADAVARHRPGAQTGRADAPAPALLRVEDRLYFAFEDGPDLNLGLATYEAGLANPHTSVLPGNGRPAASRQPVLAALDRFRIVLASVDAGTLVVRRPDPQNDLSDDAVAVSAPGRTASSPVLAAADGFYGMAWLEAGVEGREVWFRRLEADGVTMGPPVRLSTPGLDTGPPALAWDAENARFVGLWRETGSAPAGVRRLRASVGRFDCP